MAAAGEQWPGGPYVAVLTATMTHVSLARCDSPVVRGESEFRDKVAAVI